MKLQKNQRYTLNEVKQYLIENAESRAKKYCEERNVDIESVRKLFPSCRVNNYKYLKALCIFYETVYQEDDPDEIIEKLNIVLDIFSFCPDISDNYDENFCPKKDELEIDKETNKLYSKFGKKNIIKINKYIYLCKIPYEFYGIKNMVNSKIDDSSFDYAWKPYSVRRNEFLDNFIFPDIMIRLDDVNNLHYIDDKFYNTLLKTRINSLNELKLVGDINDINIVIDNLEPVIDIANERYKKIVSELPEENNGEYTIVPIYTFNENDNDVNGYPTYSKYYGEENDYVSWCVTQGKDYFIDYSKNKNAMFYFCLKNGWKDIEKPNEGKALDEYGLSMIAVTVNKDNNINTITCRWNHEKGGSDHVMSPIDLGKCLGFNFYNVIKYDEGIVERDKNDINIVENINERFCVVEDEDEGIYGEGLYNIYDRENRKFILDEFVDLKKLTSNSNRYFYYEMSYGEYEYIDGFNGHTSSYLSSVVSLNSTEEFIEYFGELTKVNGTDVFGFSVEIEDSDVFYLYNTHFNSIYGDSDDLNSILDDLGIDSSDDFNFISQIYEGSINGTFVICINDYYDILVDDRLKPIYYFEVFLGVKDWFYRVKIDGETCYLVVDNYNSCYRFNDYSNFNGINNIKILMYQLDYEDFYTLYDISKNKCIISGHDEDWQEWFRRCDNQYYKGYLMVSYESDPNEDDIEYVDEYGNIYDKDEVDEDDDIQNESLDYIKSLNKRMKLL